MEKKRKKTHEILLLSLYSIQPTRSRRPYLQRILYSMSKLSISRAFFSVVEQALVSRTIETKFWKKGTYLEPLELSLLGPVVEGGDNNHDKNGEKDGQPLQPLCMVLALWTHSTEE